MQARKATDPKRLRIIVIFPILPEERPKGQASPSFGFHPFSFRSLSFAGDTFARTFADGAEEGKFSGTGTPAGFATVVGFFSPSTSSSTMTAPDVTGDPFGNGFLGTVGLLFHTMYGDTFPSPAESVAP
tara:strand:+ start:58 stop:444 length:387 start_codon:yes stop_codon:yes gene_type:complete